MKISILIEDFEHESPVVVSDLISVFESISSMLLYDESIHVSSVNVIKRSRSVEVIHYENEKKKKKKKV